MVEALIEQVSVAPNLDATPALPNAIPTSLPAVPVTDAAEELRHLQPLLAAIAGPAIQLSVATMPCAGRTALAVEDLTRILINLVRNSADAIPTGGHIRITAQYDDGFSFLDYNNANDIFGPPRSVVITVADDGPGVPESRREQIFETGYSTRHNHGDDRLAPRRRGLGLSIVRNLVDAAGGTVRLAPQQQRGARFDIQLPITSGMYGASTNTAFAVTQA
jgi:signal transduction histidine kinase